MVPRKAGLATFLLSILIVTTACSGLAGGARGEVRTEPAASGASTSGDLQAQPTSAVSVQLSWEPVAGATEYHVEALNVDGEYFPVADLAGSESAFEDFVYPGITEIAYRVTATTPSGTTEIGTASVILPALEPNPVTVATAPYDPVIAMPDLGAFDPNTFDPSTFDPSTFDPSAFMPPGFDPENPEAFDASSLIQMVETSEEIGPEGGSISITTPDNITFTLEIPPGALEEPMVFGLLPMQRVEGIPLSGGLLGAVLIQPEIDFSFHATLSIESPVVPPATAPLTVGFAVSPILQEFYLYPLATDSAVGRSPASGAHLAAPNPRPLANGTSSRMSVGRGGTYGSGAASTGDVQAQSKRVPTDGGAQAAQHQAQDQASNPGTERSARLQEQGEGLRSRFGYQKDIRSLHGMAEALESYVQDGALQHTPELAAGLIDDFVQKVKAEFDRLKKDCLTMDDFSGSEMAGKLQSRKNDFWRLAAEAYDKKYGQEGRQLMEDLARGNKSCKFFLEIKSTIRLESPDGWMSTTVRTENPIPLSLVYIDGTIVLQNAAPGWLKYEPMKFKIASGCPSFKVTQYQRASITILDLSPLFDGSKPRDFWLRSVQFLGREPMTALDSIYDDKGCIKQETFTGGGDLWAGGYTLLRLNLLGRIHHWETSPGQFNYTWPPFVATKEFENLEIPAAGGQTLSETATYTIRVKRGSSN